MEFLRFVKRRSLLSESIYVLLNIALAVVIFALVLGVQNIWLPLVLVLLSKWRIFAVRPRYWWINIVSNMVDVIVSVSYVIMLYSLQEVLPVQIILLVLFVAWLLIIKPSSSPRMIAAQALTAVFLGANSLALVAYATDPMIFVVGFWLIGYLSARHFFTAYTLPHSRLLCLVWGFILAELGWVGYQWLFAYSVVSTASFKLVQLALVVTLLSFLAGRTIELSQAGKKFKLFDLVLPATFSFGLVAVLVFIFDNINVVGSI